MIETRTPVVALLAALVLTWNPRPAVAAEAALDLDAFVASLEGAWIGEENDTPMGKMGFATVFDWREDGSLHSHTALNSETYFDFTFRKEPDGRWKLREEGGMEGLGVQAHVLDPVGPVEGRNAYRWAYAERPGYLIVDVGVEGDTLSLDVILRGEPHAAFRLDKQSEEVRAELREEMAVRSATAPEDGDSIYDLMAAAQSSAAAGPESADPDDPIAAARRAVAEAPGDAEARLALAQALGAAIDANPANGPRYAFEMHQSLTKAVDLDPRLTEAYHWLVGYYLSAPPIAGGSVQRASEVAQQLAEFDPDGAQELLERISAAQ